MVSSGPTGLGLQLFICEVASLGLDAESSGILTGCVAVSSGEGRLARKRNAQRRRRE